MNILQGAGDRVVGKGNRHEKRESKESMGQSLWRAPATQSYRVTMECPWSGLMRGDMMECFCLFCQYFCVFRAISRGAEVSRRIQAERVPAV